EADLRVVRRFDFLSAVARSWQTELHVGLTAAEPDVAHKNFTKRDGLKTGDFDSVGAARWGRCDFYLPAALRSRDGLRGAASDFYLNGLSWLRPAPDRI